MTSRSSSCCFLAATCATLCVMLPSAADAAAEGPDASSACSCHHAASSSSLRALPCAASGVQQLSQDTDARRHVPLPSARDERLACNAFA